MEVRPIVAELVAPVTERAGHQVRGDADLHHDAVERRIGKLRSLGIIREPDRDFLIRPPIERALERAARQEKSLHDEMAVHATDFEKVAELDARLRAVLAERDDLEERWLEVAEAAQ